jgi:hypothetical protein
MSESSAVAVKKPLLSDGAYNKLKHTAAIVLPAAAALYIALAQIWHLPKVEEVAGSIASVNTFLGVVLGLSTRTYNNSDAKYAGVIKAHDDGTKITANLVLNTPEPSDILSMGSATFKVESTTEASTSK